MGAIEQYLWIMLAIYTVRAFFCFANYLRKCLIFQNENGKRPVVSGSFFM